MIRLLLFFYLTLFAASLYAEERQVVFQSLDMQQGLSFYEVNALVQDHWGFIWVGTTDGLNRFDGFDFVVYKNTKDTNSLASNYIYSLLIDSSGTLWVGTADGLHRYNEERDNFTRFMQDKEDPESISDNIITALYEDSQGILWVGTKNGGLNRFDPQTESFTHYQHNPLNRYSLSSNYVTAIMEDAAGRLWVGTDQQGLAVLFPETEKFYRFTNDSHNSSSLSHNTVLSFYIDEEQDMWIGTSFLLNKATVTKADPDDFQLEFTSIRNPLVRMGSEHRIVSITGTTDKNLYLTYKNNGLFSFDKQTGKFTAYQNVATYSDYSNPLNINDLLVDHTGLVWMGTLRSGVKLYNPGSVYGYQKHLANKPKSLPDNVIMGLTYDETHSLWMATHSKGIVHYNMKENSFRHRELKEKGDRYKRKNAVMLDRNGRLWVGTSFGFMVFPDAQILPNYHKQLMFEYKIPEIPLLKVNCFFQDSRGYVWVGTQNGLIRVDYDGTAGGKEGYMIFEHDRNDPYSLIDNKIMSLAEDQKGNLWVGTHHGLCKIDQRTQQVFCYKKLDQDQKSIHIVYDIHVDKYPVLWLGTSEGLGRFDSKKEAFTFIDEEDGLPNNTVYSVQQDEDNYLWLTSNRGLVKVDKKMKEVSRYGKNEGLPAEQFQHGAVARDKQGVFFLGTNEGLVYLNPDNLQSDQYPPKLVFTDFKCFNKSVVPGEKVLDRVLLHKPVRMTNQIELSHKHNVISFDLAALHYNNPKTNTYRYKLKGFDQKWFLHKGSKLSVNYTNLSPGKYTLEVLASNGQGVWTEEPVMMEILISPPFYRTIWFYAFCLLLLAGSVVLLIKIREKRLLESNMLLNYEKDLLQTLLDNIPDHIFFKDKNSRFIRINKVMAKNLELNHPDEAVGKSDFDFLPAEIAKKTLQEEYKILKKGDPIINDVVKRIRMGREAWVSVTKVPMFNKSGEIAGVVGISRDFTSQKEAEMKIREAEKKAVEADRMKTVFLANMSHEIRTPMNSIVGFSDLLDDPDIGPTERKDYVSYIKNNSEILMRLIDDILDTAKIEANQVKIIKKEFNLNQFMDELLDTFEINKVKLNKPHLKLSLIKKPEKKKPKVFSDPYRLKQVMSNLINNAIKFTEEGSVSFGYEVRENHSVYFFVKDTGIGIEPEMQKIVFRRFNHSEGRFEKNIQGTGLGLSISSKLVTLLGGGIELQSEPGKGSTFSFTLSNIIG